MNKKTMLILLISASVNAQDLSIKKGESELAKDGEKAETKRQEVVPTLKKITNGVGACAAVYRAGSSFYKNRSRAVSYLSYDKYKAAYSGEGFGNFGKSTDRAFVCGSVRNIYLLCQTRNDKDDSLEPMSKDLASRMSGLSQDGTSSSQMVSCDLINTVEEWQKNTGSKTDALAIAVGPTDIQISPQRLINKSGHFGVVLVTKSDKGGFEFKPVKKDTQNIPRSSEQQCLIACTPQLYPTLVQERSLFEGAINDAIGKSDDEIESSGAESLINRYMHQVAMAAKAQGQMMIIPLTKNGGGHKNDQKVEATPIENRLLWAAWVFGRTTIYWAIARLSIAALSPSAYSGLRA